MSFYDNGDLSNKSQFDAQVKKVVHHFSTLIRSCTKTIFSGCAKGHFFQVVRKAIFQVVRKAMVSAVDEAVGNIIEALETTGVKWG